MPQPQIPNAEIQIIRAKLDDGRSVASVAREHSLAIAIAHRIAQRLTYVELPPDLSRSPYWSLEELLKVRENLGVPSYTVGIRMKRYPVAVERLKSLLRYLNPATIVFMYEHPEATVPEILEACAVGPQDWQQRNRIVGCLPLIQRCANRKLHTKGPRPGRKPRYPTGVNGTPEYEIVEPDIEAIRRNAPYANAK